MKRRVTLRSLAIYGGPEKTPEIEMEASERIVDATYVQPIYYGGYPASPYWQIVIETPA